MGKRYPVHLVVAIFTQLLRISVLTAGSYIIGPRIVQEVKTDRAPIRPTVTTPKPTIVSTTPDLNRKIPFFPKKPDVFGLEPISDEEYLGTFVKALDLGLNYYQYCDLSLEKNPCEDLSTSVKGREVKEGLYCAETPADGCILIQTALPNGTLKRFFDDWLNDRMEDWEFCMSKSSNFHCGDIFTNFSRSSRQGLISPKRAANQKYSLTNYTVYVSIRCNLYPYEYRRKHEAVKNKTVSPPLKTKRPPGKKSPDSADANSKPEVDYWQYNRKYWFILSLLILAFVGTMSEIALVSWFCRIYYKGVTGFHNWIKWQCVSIGVNYALVAMFAMVLTQDIPKDSVTIWIVVFCVLMVVSTVNSCLFALWAIREQPASTTDGGNQEGPEK